MQSATCRLLHHVVPRLPWRGRGGVAPRPAGLHAPLGLQLRAFFPLILSLPFYIDFSVILGSILEATSLQKCTPKSVSKFDRFSGGPWQLSKPNSSFQGSPKDTISWYPKSKILRICDFKEPKVRGNREQRNSLILSDTPLASGPANFKIILESL